MSDAVIFQGGPIRTCDGSETPEAVLVENGRIAAIGDLGSCKTAASRTPRVVDLEGRCLLPGFVDAHMHLLLHGSRLDWVDLSPARSVDEVVASLQRWATEHPDAAAIRGYGYDQTLLREHRHPVASDLDRVDQRRPVQIQHVSGHGYVVNSLMLRHHGISSDTPVPVAGRIDIDSDGEPNGLLFDAACDLLTGPSGVKVGNHGPNFHLPIDSNERQRLLRLAQDSFLAAGVTTVCDAQVTELELGAYLSARDDGDLRLKVQLLMLSNNLDHLRAIGLSAPLGDARLQILGVKFYADGSVLARTAYLAGSCCGDDHSDRGGYLYHEPQELIELILSAHRLGLPTATHAQGSVPIGLVLQAVERGRAENPRPSVLHRIEHCGFPSDSQVAQMRTLGVVPVPQPMQVHERADALIAEFGPGGGRFYPYGVFESQGLPVVVSSDAPVTDPAPLRSVWAAVTRRTAAGEIAGGPELAASRLAALGGVTRTAASLLGRTDVGRITLGATADLVLLDGDPYAAPIDQLPTVKVTETWVDGDLAWSAALGQLADPATVG